MEDRATRFWLAMAIIGATAAALLYQGAELDHVAMMTVASLAACGALLVGRGEEDSDASVARAAPTPDAQVTSSNALDALAEPVLIVREQRIIYANPSARDLIGAHIVGEDVRTAIRHPAAATPLLDPLPLDRPRTIELVGLGSLDRRWEMRIADLGDRVRLVQLLDRTGTHTAERIRVDFVANASHELRTPLASIIGYAETLDEAAGEDPDLRHRFLGIVLGEARRMERLVEDLMSLSRIEADKFRLPATPIALCPLVEEVADTLRHRSDAVGRALTVECDEALPDVQGDRAQLSQLLHNLIGNALKYGRAGTPVAVQLSTTAGRGVRLTVSDQGDGIAPEHLPRLTERFYRVDAGRSRSLGGTGLGLAIVKHIVERHRGRLDIASEVGRGTRVTVALPGATVPAATSDEVPSVIKP